MLGASQAPRFIEAGRQNPTRSSQLSVLGSMGSNLAGDKATRPKSRKTEGYSSYGTYTVGGIEYDINSGRPTYMPAGSVYPSSSVAPFVPAQRQTLDRGPGSTPPAEPRISPEERAYNEERSRIAQLTAQNPEFQVLRLGPGLGLIFHLEAILHWLRRSARPGNRTQGGENIGKLTDIDKHIGGEKKIIARPGCL